MKNYDRQNLIVGIENSIAIIESRLDSAEKIIESVFERRCVRNIEDATMGTLEVLFSELYAIEADLN